MSSYLPRGFRCIPPTGIFAGRGVVTPASRLSFLSCLASRAKARPPVGCHHDARSTHAPLRPCFHGRRRPRAWPRLGPSEDGQAQARRLEGPGRRRPAEFQWAWQGYVAKAWGKDEINPVSGTSQSFFVEGHDLGLSLVEALDTLWIMGLDAEFQAGVDWVKANLDFDVNGEAQVFETNIRLVGGLISAHLACGDPVLLAKAKDLADRLLKAFEASPHGLPWRYVNLKTGAVAIPRPTWPRSAPTSPSSGCSAS
jgi:hypothetical protein